MAFRTVVVDSHAKLEYSLNYLVYKTPEITKRILIDEIHTLILQSTAISITTSLLSELIKHKVKVIFCDEKQNPISELVAYFGAHNSPKRILEQINWKKSTTDLVWREIVKRKIRNQAITLFKKGLEEKYLQVMAFEKEVLPGDSTNREGHAAKVYFNSVYFSGFTRDLECPLNIYLNYGYTIILSSINRLIVSSGYLTQLGIHHKNEFNEFNFSSDLIEPIRYIVDEFVECITLEDDFKEKLQSLLNQEVHINGSNQTLVNALSIYVNSVFLAIREEDPSKIIFIDNEL